MQGIPAGKLANVHTMAALGPMRRMMSVTLSEPVGGQLPTAQKLAQDSGLMTVLLLLGGLPATPPDDCESGDGCAETRDTCPSASRTQICSRS